MDHIYSSYLNKKNNDKIRDLYRIQKELIKLCGDMNNRLSSMEERLNKLDESGDKQVVNYYNTCDGRKRLV